MNIRAHISLAILTLGCMPTPATASVNPLAGYISELSKTQISALIATFGIAVWYKKRKLTTIRCTWDDFFHGRNLEHVTDIIPGFPKISGKVTFKNENGVPVSMVYKDEVKGYGLFHEIESNAKYLGRAASWPAVLLGLMLVFKENIEVTNLVTNIFGWIVGHNTKQKPY